MRDSPRDGPAAVWPAYRSPAEPAASAADGQRERQEEEEILGCKSCNTKKGTEAALARGCGAGVASFAYANSQPGVQTLSASARPPALTFP